MAPDVTLRHTSRTSERGRPRGMSASQDHGPATGRGAIDLTTPSKPARRTGHAPRNRQRSNWRRNASRMAVPRSSGTRGVPIDRGTLVPVSVGTLRDPEGRSYVSERVGQSGRAGETRKSRGALLVTCGRAAAPGWSIPDQRPAIPSLSTVASPNRAALSTALAVSSTLTARTLAHGRPPPPHRYYGDDGVRRKREDTHQPQRPRSGSLRTSVRPDLPSPVMRPRAMRDGVNPT